VGALAEYIKRKYGFLCTSRENPVTNSVAALNTEVLLNNPDRLSWLIINLDPANTLYLYFEAVTAVPYGSIVGPGGGGLTYDAEKHGELPGKRVLAGGSAYPVSIYVVEIVGLL